MKKAPKGALERGVWHVSREYAGIAEAGGLKDVVAGLATAAPRRGIPASVVLLRYGFVDPQALQAEKLPLRFSITLPSGNEASVTSRENIEVFRCRREGVTLYLLETGRTRAKGDVYTYTGADEREDPHKKKGTGHWDAHHLNLTLQRGALELAIRLKSPPDVFHCHDGHSGFLPAILGESPRYRSALAGTRALITIHNAGRGYHQEIHDPEFARQLTGLPEQVLEKGILNGTVDPLLLGPHYARVNTVSEQYALEIASGQLEDLTGGLGQAYRQAGLQLVGITNGIDPRSYDPRFPEATGLAHAFDPSREDLEGKHLCRRRLLGEIALAKSVPPPSTAFPRRGPLPGARGFPPGSWLQGLSCYGSLSRNADSPLYTFVGRLTGQKGVDILAGAIAQLLSRRAPVRFLILGHGARELEDKLAELALGSICAGRLCLLMGYNGLAAKYLFAAGDFFLVPSQYEPCGLTDLYAQMLGNLPVVHRVGGLVKVKQGYNGYSYAEHSVAALCRAIQESAADYRLRPKRLERMRRQAFQEIFDRYTWDRVLSGGYLPLYRGK